MKEVSEAARQLRALRDRAGLSRAQVGELIGMAATTYQGYETEYKKPYQPVPLIQSLLPHFVGRGEPPITRAEMLELVGPPDLLGRDVGDSELPQERASALEHGMVVRKLDPTPGDPIYDWDEAALLAMWRKLSVTKRAALFAYLGADDMPSLLESEDIRHTG